MPDTKDGEEALEVFCDPPTPIEFVLADLVMPQMGGVELADAIGQIDAALPVLFMSGYVENELLSQHASENLRVLSKPFTIDRVVSAVARCLSRSDGKMVP